ncbi:hypothetical protein [Flavivirga jejuensis]|uniref:Uncharacterized protein n=1 Tax=Flavivirga jejuensis TaxID=870487 RepID=A0ABT8WMW9_9FLAO|nr:hypothetical protein [Flavivirga jejuensis]MDO5974334.1 hypothetical protein [Flavivirga jejuensis]
MKKKLNIILLILFIFLGLKLQAQLGFCTGNSGDPIFSEDFGVGYNDEPISSGSTTYNFTTGIPRNGYYKVSSNTNWFGWFNTRDHTPNDKNGRALIVNASTEPGEFFKISVSGLCENTTYEFSSWLINLFPYNHKVCGFFKNESAIPINVTFEIWDSTDTVLIKSGDTGNIKGSYAPNWEQYGLVFQTKPGQTSVILKMRNNSIGGCGNDLAIDDIMFKTCGDSVIIEDASGNKNNISLSNNELPYSTILKAAPDFSVFSTHFYQWQKSENGIDWVNIIGENRSDFSIKKISTLSYYRVLVAEDAVNLLNSSCNSTSEIYKVEIPQPKKGAKIREKVTRINVINPKESIKTKKQVTIVMNGHKIINHEVWIDGALGKYVQTSEKIIKQGDINAGAIIEETIYYKTVYGYNSKKRIYSTK